MVGSSITVILHTWNWFAERLNNLPQIIQLDSVMVMLQTQVACACNHYHIVLFLPTVSQSPLWLSLTQHAPHMLAFLRDLSWYLFLANLLLWHQWPFLLVIHKSLSLAGFILLNFRHSSLTAFCTSSTFIFQARQSQHVWNLCSFSLTPLQCSIS